MQWPYALVSRFNRKLTRINGRGDGVMETTREMTLVTVCYIIHDCQRLVFSL